MQHATELQYDNEFDAVFSNATLHWVKPPFTALIGIYNALKKGGRFVAEFGGKGNIKTIADKTIKQIKEAGFTYIDEQFPWYFPSIGQYTALLEQVGFKVTFAQLLDRPTQLEGESGLRNWIEMFCISLFDGIPERKKLILFQRLKIT